MGLTLCVFLIDNTINVTVLSIARHWESLANRCHHHCRGSAMRPFEPKTEVNCQPMTQLIPQEESDHRPRRRRRCFRSSLATQTFQFRRARFDDRKVVGAQIAEAAGAHPIEAFVILRHLRSGELESIRPTELGRPRRGRHRALLRHHAGPTCTASSVEHLAMEWPKAKLEAKHIKFLAKAEPGQILVLETEDGEVELEDHDAGGPGR